MVGPLRREVLKAFKSLHSTRMKVFRDDYSALEAARKKINEEFRKHKDIDDSGAIQELLKLSSEVEEELRTHVVQAKEVAPRCFEARLTPDTEKMVNMPYEEMPDDILTKGKTGPCSKN